MKAPSLKDSRKNLRLQLRQTRNNLSKNDHINASLQVRQKVGLLSWFRHAQHIAFYWPNDGELSPLPILQLALNLGKKCYLPVLQGQTLLFREYKKGDKLKHNIFHIPEPLTKSPLAQLHLLDIIFVPLVGFDKRGNRLGMGGGFYDRTLANTYKRPKLIGLAHQCQLVSHIREEKWDIPLRKIITDKNCYR